VLEPAVGFPVRAHRLQPLQQRQRRHRRCLDGGKRAGDHALDDALDHHAHHHAAGNDHRDDPAGIHAAVVLDGCDAAFVLDRGDAGTGLYRFGRRALSARQRL